MARNSTLTTQQITQINTLAESGMGQRTIAKELGLTHAQVRKVIEKKTEITKQEKIAALVSSATTQETNRSVFDIMARLEECLEEIEELKDEVGPLKDRVAVRAEKRMLVAEARSTLESIYNIRVLNDFITEVTAILESESPGARRRIFKRLEASTGATAAISLFASNRNGV